MASILIANSMPMVGNCRQGILKVGPSLIIFCQAKTTSSHTVPTSGPAYQYLERSPLPTLKFQKSLPRLPIPKLEKTIERYLAALEPIIQDKQQYENTTKIANKFRDGEGKELHSKLLSQDKSNKHTSYISKPWFDMYLESRVPLVLNFNPFMAWKDDPDSAYMKLPIRVTNMLISALRFRRSLRENVLTPEVFHMNPDKSDTDFYRTVIKYTPEAIAAYVSMAMKAFPLDMSQFASLFNGTRIPRKGKDVLETYPNSRHIAFLKGGQFFIFDVLDEKGDIKSPEEIYALVSEMVNLKVDTKLDSITPLSAENRDFWAAARDRLISSSRENQDNLHLLDSAIFLICLDDLSFNVGKPGMDGNKQEQLDAGHNYLHGNSKKQGNRPLNRWFDKSFGMMFDQEGHASITFEHSWGDGVAVLRVFNDIYKDSTSNHFVGPETKVSSSSSQVKHLKFTLSPESKNDVKTATENWKSFTSKLELDFTLYDKMSRDYLKKKKVSPDSVFQLAFQMAFYKVYKTFAPTYESCSTSAFKHGRTEVVRAATMETKSAAEAFANSKDIRKDAVNLRKLVDACSKKHFQLTKEAAMGQGFDRHLFGLRLIAEKEGRPKPEIFTDKTYTEATHYILSTSSLYGNYFSAGGFAPVVEDGFGLGYGYVDDNLGLLASSYKGKRDGKKLVEAFVSSLDQIREVLEEAPVPEKGK